MLCCECRRRCQECRKCTCRYGLHSPVPRRACMIDTAVYRSQQHDDDDDDDDDAAVVSLCLVSRVATLLELLFRAAVVQQFDIIVYCCCCTPRISHSSRGKCRLGSNFLHIICMSMYVLYMYNMIYTLLL